MKTVPVNMIANCWFADIKWAGFAKSPMLEIDIIHLNEGAQKKTKTSNQHILLTIKIQQPNQLLTCERSCWMR